MPPWVVVTMRKAKVWRAWGEPLLLRPWYVDLGEARQGSGIWCATHAEAMFLAQLLADPHEYIRAAQERAWEAGFDGGEKDAFSHQTFNEPCIPNPYRKEDNESHMGHR